MENPTPALLARLDALHLRRSPEGMGALIPVRSRWPLLFPEEGILWTPRPQLRGPDGFPFAPMPLTPLEMEAWRQMNGSRTLAQVSQRSGLGLAALLNLTDRLCAAHVQALQLRDTALSVHDRSPEHLVAPPRPDFTRPRDADGTNTAEWHRQIETHLAHFDDVETTLAHAFAVPHPALGGQPYGVRLGERLLAEGLLGDADQVLEIGPGTGELGAALHARLPGLRWTRLDLAPALLAAQAAVHPDSEGVAGDATAMPLPDESVDFVLCNEVIADLETRTDPGPLGAFLEPEPGQTLFNTGAFALLAELRRVLRPGGAAWISEFGGPDELPTETRQLDHPEVSIHFGQLARVATSLGLTARLVPVGEFLGFDPKARWLARSCYEGLRARLRADGKNLEARAWTLGTLALPWTVEGLREVPVHEDGPGPVYTRFWALLVQRPAQDMESAT